MLALNIASMRAHTRPCLLRRMCLFWTFTCIFEHELAYFKFSIVYLLFSLINVQLSALYLEFAFKGILKICLLPRSANQKAESLPQRPISISKNLIHKDNQLLMHPVGGGGHSAL